jgi:Protein of unknown function (DUF3617)
MLSPSVGSAAWGGACPFTITKKGGKTKLQLNKREADNGEKTGIGFGGRIAAGECGRGRGGVDMQDGLWEITTTTEMAGMPFQIPPMTITQCITQQDLVPQDEQPGNECTLTHT